MTFDSEIVWASAVAVDRINGGYFKEPVHEYIDDTRVVKTHPNKLLMRRWLADEIFDQVTDADRIEGERLRHYFNGYLLKEIAGNINDFEQTVLRIAQCEQFTNRSLLQFAIISCLPDKYRKDIKNTEFRQEVIDSIPIKGDIGDIIVGELIVVKSYYSKNYNKFSITGRFGESFVNFWFKEELIVDSIVKIKGRIKRHRDDNTTQLNYVRTIK